VQTNDYDSFAEAYAAENESNFVNARYERPAVLALAGDVSGHAVLDAGCGAGPLTAALRERGATVTGLDISSEMIALARRRLGSDADLLVGDLSDPLPFADASFDLVTASLVLHYLEDWGPTLREFQRVLRPGGRLIASVDHPIVAYTFRQPWPNYFAPDSYTFTWTIGGHSAPMKFWRKSLGAMTGAFHDAGFRLSVISEPQPDPSARELFPDDFERQSSTPGFLFFVVDVPPAGNETQRP
jgi:SAM-dependent methyltransferase